MKQIPIFRLSFSIGFITDFIKGSVDILRSGRPLGEGKFYNKFCNSFKKLHNSEYCIAVSNGTVAIELIIKALSLQGTEIILPSNTFFATIVAVRNSGNIPVMVDAEIDSFSICPKDLAKKINKNTSAVILVHIGGIISPHIQEISKICKENDIHLIEDAAHAHLSAFKEKKAGTIGIAGAFSFFPTKVMTTGEGGAIVTNCPELSQKINSLKNFGRDPENGGLIINPLGNNYKVHELTSLLGFLESKRVEKRVQRRNKLIQRYVKNLKNTNYSVVQQEESFGLCSYYKCIIKTEFKITEGFKEYFKKNGISLTGEVYSIPIHLQPLFKDLFSQYKLPNTDWIASHHFCPPLYPELSIKEVDYICKIIKDYQP